MSNLITYNGYRGQVEFSDEESTFYGKILGINDLVTFEGSSVLKLKKAFEESVNDYIETCEEFGKDPEKEYKGQFNVRISKELHRLAVSKATAGRITLNKFVVIALKKAVHSEAK